jgi:phosphoribosylformylglycinamidine synthase
VVDEAVRNVVAVGGDPERTALLDNFSWGNPALEDRLGALVRAAQGCHDAALAFRTPFISGKDSLNNEYTDPHGEKRTIPPTLLISSLSVMADVRKAVTMDVKCPGNKLYVVGETRNELGGALYSRVYGTAGSTVPAPVPEGLQTMRVLHRAISGGLVRACHDLSEGGLAVAAAEMASAGRLGLELELAAIPRSADVATDDTALFSESNARFLVEIEPDATAAFEETMKGHPTARVGSVTDGEVLRVSGISGRIVIDCAVERLSDAFLGGTAGKRAL